MCVRETLSLCKSKCNSVIRVNRGEEKYKSQDLYPTLNKESYSVALSYSTISISSFAVILPLVAQT